MQTFAMGNVTGSPRVIARQQEMPVINIGYPVISTGFML